MKQAHPLAALLTLFLIGSSSLLQVQAAPQEQEQEHREESHQHAHSTSQSPQAKPGKTDRHKAQQSSAQPGKNQPQSQHPSNKAPATSQRPPSDFSQVRRDFHERRGQIGAGPAVPVNVQIRKGQPLPKGYGKRLDERALHGLPRYEGYEWRRIGSDVVLVTVATGIVYTVLQGVLQ